ncbi:MAG: hypothetical protein KBT46_08485 [Ruminococcus sp.]|nr:hypothetical protein [Candidatus Copronaster equi]
MKKKLLSVLLTIVMVIGMIPMTALPVFAREFIFKGVDINAGTVRYRIPVPDFVAQPGVVEVNDTDLILEYTESSTLTLSGTVTADILVVGGGGAGGTVRSSSQTNHSGGGGGRYKTGADGGSGVVIIRLKGVAATVAKIGDTEYTSLADAVAAVPKDGTATEIKLLSNIETGGILIPSGVNLTIDFDGKTVSFKKPGIGSSGGKGTVGFYLKGGSVKMKNGTINCTAENKDAIWDNSSSEKGIAMMLQNFADLTLDGMTVDGTNIAHNGSSVCYVMSNNAGNTVINNTVITAASGDFAFDSCKNDGYDAPTVEIKGTSVITGKVELSGGKVTVGSGISLSTVTADGYNEGDLVILYAVTNTAPSTSATENHGYITVDKTDAAEGDTVTVTVNPAKGYKLKSLKVLSAISFAPPITPTQDEKDKTKYTFAMPGYPVNVKAEFEKASTAIKIFVLTPAAKTVTLDVEPNEMIENIKAKIQDKEGIPPKEQSLFFNETPLEDSKILSDYSIQNEDTVTLTVTHTLEGGYVEYETGKWAKKCSGCGEYDTANTVTGVIAPAGAENLVYNGLKKTGVEAGTGYTLSGTYEAVNAGTYKATATLADGYIWSDGTTTAKEIVWSIAERADYSKLESVFDSLKDIIENENDYNKLGNVWTEFLAKYKAAGLIDGELAKSDANQQIIDNAAKELKEALDALRLAKAKESAKECFSSPLNSLCLGYYSSELVEDAIAGLDTLTSAEEIEQYKADYISILLKAREDAFKVSPYSAIKKEIEDICKAFGFNNDKTAGILSDFDEFISGEYDNETREEVIGAIAEKYGTAQNDTEREKAVRELYFSMLLMVNSNWMGESSRNPDDMNETLIRSMILFDDNDKIAEAIDSGNLEAILMALLECYPDYAAGYSKVAGFEDDTAFDTVYASLRNAAKTDKAKIELTAAKTEAIEAVTQAFQQNECEEAKAIAEQAIKDIEAAETVSKVEEIKSTAISEIQSVIISSVCPHCGQVHKNIIYTLVCYLMRAIRWIFSTIQKLVMSF